MTNSIRRRPFAAYCGGSQKFDKRIGNRALRRKNRVLLQTDPDPVFWIMDEVMNQYSMVQDGSRQWQPFWKSVGPFLRWPLPGETIESVYRRWYRWAKAK